MSNFSNYDINAAMTGFDHSFLIVASEHIQTILMAQVDQENGTISDQMRFDKLASAGLYGSRADSIQYHSAGVCRNT
jgi:hypothetical protein